MVPIPAVPDSLPEGKTSPAGIPQAGSPNKASSRTGTILSNGQLARTKGLSGHTARREQTTRAA